jgi:hypothetical protein
VTAPHDTHHMCERREERRGEERKGEERRGEERKRKM